MTGVEVYCTIRNCHYWSEGEHCSAAKILITTDEIGRIYPEAADADAAHDLTRQHGPTEARTCMETCCKTFTPRGQGRPSGTPDQRGAAAPATR